MSVRWKRNGVDVVNSDQVSLEDSTRKVAPGIYELNLIFDSIQYEANGNYSCDSDVSVSVQGFQSQVTGNPAFHTIAILSKFLS